MSVEKLTSPSDQEAYREWLKNAQEVSLWQSLEWKGYQGALGRETRLYGLKRQSDWQLAATALVIIDRTALSFSTWDIPRGPLFTDALAAQELLWHILSDAKKDRCMALYFSPPGAIFNFQFSIFNSRSKRAEQPEATLVLDLTLSDEELIAQMHEKGRYNIRVAKKHGVRVGESRDIGAFYALLQSTAQRDRFGLLPKTHYECFLKDLPGSFLLLAYPQWDYGQRTTDKGSSCPLSPVLCPYPVAGLLGVTWGKTGIYYYGASDYAYRSLMAPYLLQWEAMRLCRSRGCTEYDFLGIAPFARHPWGGLTRFKMQFGGIIRTSPPEQEVVLRPRVKAVLDWKRRCIG